MRKLWFPPQTLISPLRGKDGRKHAIWDEGKRKTSGTERKEKSVEKRKKSHKKKKGLKFFFQRPVRIYCPVPLPLSRHSFCTKVQPFYPLFSRGAVEKFVLMLFYSKTTVLIRQGGKD